MEKGGPRRQEDPAGLCAGDMRPREIWGSGHDAPQGGGHWVPLTSHHPGKLLFAYQELPCLAVSMLTHLGGGASLAVPPGTREGGASPSGV